MKILPIYASLLAVMFVYLSIRTIRTRRKLRIGIGHADNPVMLRAMRVHANFAEYVPLAMLLIFFVESSAARPFFVHSLGIALLIARLSHAFGLSRDPEDFRFRVFGVALTFAVILVCASSLLYTSLTR